MCDHDSLSSAAIKEENIFRDPLPMSYEPQDDVDVPSWWQAGGGLLRRPLPCDYRCHMHATHQQICKPSVMCDHHSLSSAEIQEWKIFRDPFAMLYELQDDVDLPSWWQAEGRLLGRLPPCDDHCCMHVTHWQACKPSLKVITVAYHQLNFRKRDAGM